MHVELTGAQLNAIIDALNYAAVNAATVEEMDEYIAVARHVEQTAKA